MGKQGKMYFTPGANPPFPGYDAWLEEAKRAPIWQAKGLRPYVPDMRDGLGKELFPPAPPRLNIDPKPSRFYDRETALAAIELVWRERHDLVWEALWELQYMHDDPDENLRSGDERKYVRMAVYAAGFLISKAFPSADITLLSLSFYWDVGALRPHLPLSVRRAPWAMSDGRLPD